MRWLSLVTPAADGSNNMALDEALMRRAARTGDAAFRVYSWSAPTLSLGRNQRARDCYEANAARSLGVSFVRRPTGGRALLHYHEVTYSATLPMADGGQTAREAYDFINGVLLGGLVRLGVTAQRATDTKSLAPGLRPCFDVPSEREIVVNGRKLVGSAQWCHDGALLQHGSILVRDDQPLIARLMKAGGPPRVASAAATLADSLGWEPVAEQVAAPLFESLESAAGARVEPLVLDDALTADITHLRATYGDDRWTWRR